jgi:hypothetical protein
MTKMLIHVIFLKEKYAKKADFHKNNLKIYSSETTEPNEIKHWRSLYNSF